MKIKSITVALLLTLFALPTFAAGSGASRLLNNGYKAEWNVFNHSYFAINCYGSVEGTDSHGHTYFHTFNFNVPARTNAYRYVTSPAGHRMVSVYHDVWCE